MFANINMNELKQQMQILAEEAFNEKLIYGTSKKKYDNLTNKKGIRKSTIEKEINYLSDLLISNKSKKVKYKTNYKALIKDLNSKIKSTVGIKHKLDKKALGDVFKKSYMNEDLNHSFEFIKHRIIKRLHDELDANNKKYNLIAYIIFQYEMKGKDGTFLNYFHSDTMYITSKNIISGYMDDTFNNLQNHIEVTKQKSDLVFVGFTEITISTSRNKAISGKQYFELPLWIKNKKCCVNIKNTDDKCFLWSLIASRNYDMIKSKDKNETRHYKKYIDSIVEPENVSYPVKLNDISLWEDANNMKINIIAIIEGEQDFENKYTRNVYNENVVNLLLITEGENSHYVWIKSIEGLYASKTNHKTKIMCHQCLCTSFSTQEKLDDHIKYKLCQSFNVDMQPCIPIMPEEGKNILKFTNKNNEFMHPFFITADFESTLAKVEDTQNKSTQKYQQHIQNSYGIKYNCIHDEFSDDIKLFNHQDPEKVTENFILDLEKYAKKSYDLLQQNKHNIVMTDEEETKHKKSKTCCKCSCEYTSENKKVRHHDHITGDFIGSYCNKCNLEYQYKRFLPVYLHNLKGYDSHLFVKGLFQYGYKPDNNSDNITCIPNNEERYISFSKMIKVDDYMDKTTDKSKNIMFEIRFLDSLSFMATSIEKLADNLALDKTTEEKRKVFKNISQHFSDDIEFELMTKKGIYPYDYIDKYERLFENKLPSKDCFNSKLYDSTCDDLDYKTAQDVWNTFKCKSMLEYHNLYLITDVLLLSDIWQNFRNVCYKNYNLDACYYYTAPGLSWDSMLKSTKIEIELLTDLEMFEFVERGIRGGISQISKRHAIANNKYMTNYDKSKEDSYIVYLDANNLYGGAMCKSLPYKDFKWNTDKWDLEKIMNITDISKEDKFDDTDTTGYLFSVDLHIPKELHEKMNNYPPCPENICIDKDDLNDWQQKDYKKSNVKKLCLTFHDKINYVINYRLLKLYLSLGVELKKVNKVLQYTQKRFMKSYIMLNTNLRKKSNNEFEKDFYKLMNNAVFGKTMENVRKRINFRLINTEDQALRVKNMKRFTIFNEDLVGLHIQKTEVKLNKPIFLGQNILDESKFTMYNFHYNFMLEKIQRKNLDILMTDTDSLCYHIRNEDIFEIIKKNEDYFDLSNYPKEHELYNKKNCKELEKMKNESPAQITEFIALRAKLYTFTVDGENKSHNKCKGVQSCVAKKLKIDEYRDVLYNRSKKIVSQNGIRSYGHELFTEQISKVALSGNDDKVYICDNNVNTRNHGHYLNK